MTNKEIARLLTHIALAYQLKGEDRFRIIAYERAAETIRELTEEVSDLWKAKKLTTIFGVGPALASHLDELLTTGEVKHFRQLLKDIPPSVFVLLDVPGFGIKRAYKLVKHFRFTDPKTIVDDIAKSAKAGKIASIEGFGDKSQAEILTAVKRYKRGQIKDNRMPLPYAYAIAEDIIDYLKDCPATIEAFPLGSLRRMVATIGDIDVAVSTKDPEKVTEWFLNYPKLSKVVEKGKRGTSIILSNGHQIDMRVIPPAQWGSMLQYFTGSKNHNIKLREHALKKGFSLSEYGIKPIVKSVQRPASSVQLFNKKTGMYEFNTEENFYQFLGLPWIPPELREDRGEIETKPYGLPKLVELKDIKGDFHIHTNYPIEPSHDLGVTTLVDILHTAQVRGYEYVGISDHNPSIGNHTEKQIITILKGRKEHYEHILSSTKSVRVKLFIMIEADILPDGQCSIPEGAMPYLDAMIVSVHSVFSSSRKKMTDRILKTLCHPKAKILGHPTGRLINKREGYDLDWERLFEFCKNYDKALEINANPRRLDLSDTLAAQAAKQDVKLVIGTDSHAKEHMSLMPYGVAVGRRAWLTNADIINTMPYNEVREWLIDD